VREKIRGKVQLGDARLERKIAIAFKRLQSAQTLYQNKINILNFLNEAKINILNETATKKTKASDIARFLFFFFN